MPPLSVGQEKEALVIEGKKREGQRDRSGSEQRNGSRIINGASRSKSGDG